MVDEFSSFARMPKPADDEDDLARSCAQAVFLMRVGHPDIAFEDDVPDEPLIGALRRRLMAQALTNVVKNATEAIAARDDRASAGQGTIVGQLRREDDIDRRSSVIDNGKGLPRENRQRLLEPYMTTREKGTGLGLAIVSKIVEDHGGGIELLDAPDGRRAAGTAR